jgi:hypothetical protein
MPTQAELRSVASALNGVSALTQGALRRHFNGALDTDGRAVMSRQLVAGWQATLSEYGQAAASLGADMSEQWIRGLGRRPRVEMSAVDAARAAGRLRWALDQPDQWGNLRSIADELVKGCYRETVARSSDRSRVGYVRVPMGDTCAFCLMLASEGIIHSSGDDAGEAWHGYCDCTLVPARDESDYPDGFDPDRLYDEYHAARDAAGPRPSTSAILHELRVQQGIK